jgi:hypothetical protein
MTTTVKVEAHVSETKQVVVQVFDGTTATEKTILQDGESVTYDAYDERVVTVREDEKNAAQDRG